MSGLNSQISQDRPDGPIITLVGGSRRKNNPNHRLETLLSSIVSNTNDLGRVEVVARIDADDEMAHFDSLRARFPFFRYVVGDRGNGYRDLHKMESAAWYAASPSSEFAFVFSDDFVISRRDWDEDIARCVAINRESRVGPNILFIDGHGRSQRQFTDYDTLLYVLEKAGPQSFLPIVHRSILDAATTVSARHGDWTPFGNILLCDSFFEFLRFYLWERTGVDWITRIPGFFSQLDEVASVAHKGHHRWAKTVVGELWPKLIAPAAQSIVAEMASETVTRSDLLRARAGARENAPPSCQAPEKPSIEPRRAQSAGTDGQAHAVLLRRFEDEWASTGQLGDRTLDMLKVIDNPGASAKSKLYWDYFSARSVLSYAIWDAFAVQCVDLMTRKTGAPPAMNETGLLAGQLAPERLDALRTAYDACEPCAYDPLAFDFRKSMFNPWIFGDTEREFNQFASYRRPSDGLKQVLKAILEDLRPTFERAMGHHWRVVATKLMSLKPLQTNVGPHIFHRDSHPACTKKWMIYLGPTNEHDGSTEYKTRDGGTHIVRGDGGDWILFENSRLLHRGLPPRTKPRPIIEVTFMPSLFTEADIVDDGINAGYPWFPPASSRSSDAGDYFSDAQMQDRLLARCIRLASTRGDVSEASAGIDNIIRR
jgi:hypothetical protein